MTFLAMVGEAPSQSTPLADPFLIVKPVSTELLPSFVLKLTTGAPRPCPSMTANSGWAGSEPVTVIARPPKSMTSW